MPTDPTAAPRDLDAQAKRLYYRLRGFLRDDFKTWHDSDREALATVCRWAQRARVARDQIPVDEHGKPELTAPGYKGQAVPHPLVKIAEGSEAKFLAGLSELGFTPAARKRLEMEVKRGRGGKFGSLGS